MTGRLLTDADCAAIVSASVRPGRVLAGPTGHDHHPPDILLTTVEAIARRIVADTLHRAADDLERDQPTTERFGYPLGVASWLHERAQEVRNA